METAWNSDDEHAFTLLLEGELDKIHDFQKFKVSRTYITLRTFAN